MGLLIEILFSLIRIIVLLTSVLITFLLGEKIYASVNSFLYINYYPCLELISILAITIPPLAFLYGVWIKKHFLERPNHYNWNILIISFIIGIVFAFLPTGFNTSTGVLNTLCVFHPEIEGKLAQIIITGILISFNAFVGMDAGVFVDKLSRFMSVRKSSIRKITKS